MGTCLKNGYFTAIGSYSVKMVTNKYIGPTCCLSQQALATGSLDLSASMTLHDLEPWTIGNFSVFFKFSALAQISKVNCAEIAEAGQSAQAYKFF